MKNYKLFLLGTLALISFELYARQASKSHFKIIEESSSFDEIKEGRHSCIYHPKTGNITCHPLTETVDFREFTNTYISCTKDEPMGHELIGVYKNPDYEKNPKHFLPYCSIWVNPPSQKTIEENIND